MLVHCRGRYGSLVSKCGASRLCHCFAACLLFSWQQECDTKVPGWFCLLLERDCHSTFIHHSSPWHPMKRGFFWRTAKRGGRWNGIRCSTTTPCSMSLFCASDWLFRFSQSTFSYASQVSAGPWNSFEMGSGIPRGSTPADSYIPRFYIVCVNNCTNLKRGKSIFLKCRILKLCVNNCTNLKRQTSKRVTLIFLKCRVFKLSV